MKILPLITLTTGKDLGAMRRARSSEEWGGGVKHQDIVEQIRICVLIRVPIRPAVSPCQYSRNDGLLNLSKFDQRKILV
jgi:hypothetical protein